MDYYERKQDRADNNRQPVVMDEDYAYEQQRQRDLDNAVAFYDAAVAVEKFERRFAA